MSKWNIAIGVMPEVKLKPVKSSDEVNAEHREFVNALRIALGKSPLYDVEKEEGGRGSTYRPNDVHSDGCTQVYAKRTKAA